MNTILRKFALNTDVIITTILLFLTASSIPASAQIATGINHTLAIQSDGTLWAWGYNYYGQLGDGTTVERTTAVQVLTTTGTLTNVADISAGANHSLALDNTGAVWAWGCNTNGQLGNGTTTSSSRAVQMRTASGNLTGVVAVAAGDNFSVALKSDGTVWTTGLNSTGQLGIGSTTQQTLAVQVTGLSGVLAISAGATHVMALKYDGTVWTWGNNSNGQLGNNSTTQETSPVQVTGLGGIGQIAAGGTHSVAMKVDGSVVWAWGNNGNGQLGDNTTTQRLVPVQVIGVSNAKAISAGLAHSVALENDGTVWCWGHNYVGELGLGTTIDQHEAVQMPGVGKILALTARGDRTLMYTNTGTILGVGDDFYGGLGDRRVGYQLSPYSVTALTGVTAVSGGNGYHSLALKSDGTLWVAGLNNYGQLGTNNQLNSNTFVQVTKGSGYLTGVIAAAGGGSHSLALTSDNTVWGWGEEVYGEVGDGATATQVLQPAQVVTASGTLTGITAIAAGNNHSLALRNDGTVWAWGANSSGQLGNNSTTNSNKAVEVLNNSGTALTGITAIAAGGDHSVALKSDGTLWAWGNNLNGQIGDGTTTNRTEAVPVSLSGATVVAVVAGMFHTMAIKSDNTVLAWGYNAYGTLGDGSGTTRLTPVAVLALSSVASIYGGDYHSMATETNGSFWTWGFDNDGEAGNGTFDLNNHATPTQVTGITSASGANPGSAGAYHNLLVNSAGVLTAFGNGMYGQLGDGIFGYAASPVTAVFTVTQDTTGLWVDQNAAPGGTGTYASPFQTIAAAVTQSAKTGDTNMRITIRAGTYREGLSLDGTYAHAKSGTAATHFVCRGMPGERVIVSGMKQITGWSLYSGNIYVANIGTWNPTGAPNPHPDTFYFGMNEHLLAQSPNAGTGYWKWQSSAGDGNGNTIITDPAHLTNTGTLTGGYVQLYGQQGGQIEEVWGGTVVANDPVAGTVTLTGTYTNTTGHYIIKGCLQLLDSPGEWCPVAQGDGTYKMYYWPVNAAEATNLLSSNPSTQARNANGEEVLVRGVSYVDLTGLEIIGGSGNPGNGVLLTNDTNCTVSNCVIHDNGGFTWSGGTPMWGGAATGIELRGDTNCTVSNNVITLNANGLSIWDCTNTTITENDIGYNYIDGIDLMSEGLGSPCVNTTISNNYVHHNFNLWEHADAMQPRSVGVEQMNVLNNVFLAQIQVEISGLSGGIFQNNVIWHSNIDRLGKDTPNPGATISLSYNTIEDSLFLGSGTPASTNEDIIYGQLGMTLNVDTGDRDLLIPVPFSYNSSTNSTTYGPYQLTSTPAFNNYGYQTPAPGAVVDFFNLTGQQQHAQLVIPTNPPPTAPQFVNMPTTIRSVDYVNNMAKFTTNTTSTTVPLYANTTTGFFNNSQAALGDFVVGDYIEWNMDGIVRHITAVDTVNNTITFTPALYGFTPGDGLGWPQFPRNDFVERWGTNTNFQRDSRLAAGSPGLTMSPTGGPIGCNLNISQYQLDDFDGDGLPDVPPVPLDVQTNRAAHLWHTTPWFNYGDH